MPKLLQIDSCIGIGSTGRIAESIGVLARSQGWDCYMAHGCRYVGPSKLKSIPIGSRIEEYLHYGQSLIMDNHGLASVNATKKFVKQIEEIHPDIIQLHNIHGYYLNYQVLFEYLKGKNIPIVWTQHDCWAFTGHCVHYTAVNCDKWKTLCYNCPRLKDYPCSLGKDNTKRNYELKKRLFTSINNMTVVTVSKWLADVVSESFLGKYPIQVIQNGIDINTFKPYTQSHDRIRRKYNLKDKFIILGVATGWSKNNGFYDFLELRKILDDRFEIVLVGVTQTQKESLPDGITGILRTDNKQELAEVYSTANLFVNGSFEETFGLVTAEAISCGTPAIVYNSTACPSIVTEQTGYVIPVKDIKMMKQSVLMEYGKSASEREGTSLFCRKYAEQYFNEMDRYKEYVDLYNSLLK